MKESHSREIRSLQEHGNRGDWRSRSTSIALMKLPSCDGRRNRSRRFHTIRKRFRMKTAMRVSRLPGRLRNQNPADRSPLSYSSPAPVLKTGTKNCSATSLFLLSPTISHEGESPFCVLTTGELRNQREILVRRQRKTSRVMCVLASNI